MEGMQVLDEQGNVIQNSDYDELESIFSKGAPASEDEEVVEEIQDDEKEVVQTVKKVDEAATVVNAASAAAEVAQQQAAPPSDAEDLRLLLREQRKQLALMQAKLDRLDKRPVSVVTAENELEDDDEDNAAAKIASPPEEVLADIEIYQQEINAIAEERESTLTNLLAIMTVNPKYADVEEVCSRQRFDDIFEAAASDMVAKEGGDLTTAQLAIELNIWKKPNPYAYMYDIIKKYHPDFVTSTTPEKEEKVVPPRKEKTPPNTPLSALDLGKGGGGGKSFGEWSAERIDAMPEYDLYKIPKDVYDAYLRGDLDK